MNFYEKARLFFLYIYIGISVLTAQAVRADTIIDTFDSFSAGLWPAVTNAGTPLISNSDPGLAGVVGGVRDGTVQWQAGPLNVTAAVLPGFYFLSSDALTDGRATLSYNAGGAGLNLDLSYGDLNQSTIFIDVISSDLGGVPVDVTLTDGGGNTSTTSTVAAGAGTVSIPLSTFLPLVDFSDLDEIVVAFDPPSEFDIAVDFIGFDWVDAAIPEPTTLALLGLGLAGIGFARGRKAS